MPPRHRAHHVVEVNVVSASMARNILVFGVYEAIAENRVVDFVANSEKRAEERRGRAIVLDTVEEWALL